MWLFSLSTVQLRKQLMVWSSYFWLGALRTRVTGLSTVPESMAHITSRLGLWRTWAQESFVSRLRNHLRRNWPSNLLHSGHRNKYTYNNPYRTWGVEFPLYNLCSIWRSVPVFNSIKASLLWPQLLCFWRKKKKNLSVLAHFKENMLMVFLTSIPVLRCSKQNISIYKFENNL